MTQVANGIDATIARAISKIKSRLISPRILNKDAPSTFLIPISLVRCIAVRDDNPNNPRQAIKMAKPAKIPKIFPNCWSALYC